MTKTLRASVVLLVLFLPACAEIQALLFSVPIPSIGAGGTLDVSEWALVQVPVNSTPVPVDVGIHDLSSGALQTYDFPQLFENDLQSVRGISVNPQGVLAAATLDGVVGLSRIGVGTFDAQRAMGARAIAWSNGGDRIAVVTIDEQDALKLEIVDSDLGPLSQRSIDLPRDVFAFRDSSVYCVSWSPDDGQLAISTDRAHSSTPSECIVLDLFSDRIDRYALSNVHFIGPNRIVGNEAGIFSVDAETADSRSVTSIPGAVVVMDVAAGEIVSRSLIDGARIVVGSYLRENMYVTQELAVALFYAPIRLRHADGRVSAQLGGPVNLGGFGTFGRASQMALIPKNVLDTNE